MRPIPLHVSIACAVLFSFTSALMTSAASALPESVDAYDVVWTSPSDNASGSMPLGNGDIGLNAWVQPDGSLHFFISKTDAWDDNARLLKVGKIRIDLDPNPFREGRSFQQRLHLQTASLEVVCGTGPDQVRIRLWVDANHPVIQATIESASPLRATAHLQLWRTNRQELAELQVSDVLLDRSRADQRHAPMFIEPDTILTGQQDRIGWFHHNIKSVGPELLAQVQGLTGFPQPDPLLHRTFGAVVTVRQGRRLDDQRLESPRGTSHAFSVLVLTRHPATPESWLADVDRLQQRVDALGFEARRQAHETWWETFWNRSWIRAALDPNAKPAPSSLVPRSPHAVRIGSDPAGGNRYGGELGRVSLWNRPLAESEIAVLARQRPEDPVRGGDGLLISTNRVGVLPGSTSWDWSCGLSMEAWIKPEALPGGGARLIDQITPGGSDGFLLDTHPGNSLRFICGSMTLQHPNGVPPGQWTHVAAVADPAADGCRLYLNGKRVSENGRAALQDEAAYVSQMYHLQRFISACAGRGAYPIKFNGSIFTVPPPDRSGDPDYRRWGPGYWWQNTRLPYISMCRSGDFDLMQPLFRMYVDELLELCRYRTRLYCGHAGAFYPECIHFWGPIFSETYGWTPFEERQDKLQESGWHKWEWVGGLELGWLALDYYEHTLDAAFLKQKALPLLHETLTFFDQHYPTNAQGRLVMHPSQALETWWHCTNAMPELAGCRALTERLLALPAELVPAEERTFWQRLHAKLPPLPLRDVAGKMALAPAETFDQKRNIENPELYAVFPFRLVALGRPNLDWGLAALEHRWDKGNFGWRQDDIFMAYLGLTDQARQFLVGRARNHDRNSRFPAFWGPNYDWIPDQDHGGVLMKTFQAMLLQTDGRKIYLRPAWPESWNADFKLHAPHQTVVQGSIRGGRIESLLVTPPERAQDLILDWRKP